MKNCMGNILRSIKHQRGVEEKKLYQKYTFMELIDKLDVIECYHRPGHRMRISEMTEEQKDLYTTLGFEPPA